MVEHSQAWKIIWCFLREIDREKGLFKRHEWDLNREWNEDICRRTSDQSDQSVSPLGTCLLFRFLLFSHERRNTMTREEVSCRVSHSTLCISLSLQHPPTLLHQTGRQRKDVEFSMWLVVICLRPTLDFSLSSVYIHPRFGIISYEKETWHIRESQHSRSLFVLQLFSVDWRSIL